MPIHFDFVTHLYTASFYSRRISVVKYAGVRIVCAIRPFDFVWFCFAVCAYMLVYSNIRFSLVRRDAVFLLQKTREMNGMTAGASMTNRGSAESMAAR
jgi:predicted ABC-type exoprotein transport system permease subunit